LELNLCYGCMELKTDDLVCPHCGYNHNAPSLPSYLAPGIMLNDRYSVGKLKSYNGESAIYIGYDVITQTKVLIKEYMPDTLCVREKGSPAVKVNPNYVAQYKTFMSDFVELNKVLTKMRTLSHINAATDMFGANNTGYVIFPFVEGITLGEYLKKNAGELTLDEVKRIFPPLFTTFSLVHNAGIVHRGVSPENIIVTKKGELKLQGFGFCISDARTANTELASELYSGYAAPEQYNSANWQGTWTDIYGISALLYRILTGTTPVEATSRMSSDNLLEPALINRSLPPNVSKVIMNGMHMSGEMRIQTVTELVTQLFEQPEYNSMRLSSSSTQTITIPKQSLRNGGGYVARQGGSTAVARTAQPIKNTRISRKSIFFTAGAVTLFIGMFFLIVMLNAINDRGVSGPGSEPPNISGGIQSDTTEAPESTVLEIMTTTTTQRPHETTGAPIAQVYVMNNITGKSYDLIKSNPSYDSLTFEPVFEFTDEAAKGIIYEQSIEVGDRYEGGAEITVKVSLGPKFIRIPEFIGLTKRDYFSILSDAGIKFDEKELQTNNVQSGYVASLSKEPGEMIDVEEGEMLTVFIAAKPPETAPPETTRATRGSTETETEQIFTIDETDIYITFW